MTRRNLNIARMMRCQASDAEPPSNLPVEHLKFRRYFEIRLGLAPVGASSKIGLVFDQRRVDELWNEKECRAYVPIFFRPQSVTKRGRNVIQVGDFMTFMVRSPLPVGVFANYDYDYGQRQSAAVGFGLKPTLTNQFRHTSCRLMPTSPDLTREEYITRAIQDQWVEEVDPLTCKKYLSQKIGAIVSSLSTAVESPAGTLASRIEENLYSEDEDDRFDTLLKREVEHRCSLLEDCREQRRRLVDENKRKLFSRWDIDE